MQDTEVDGHIECVNKKLYNVCYRRSANIKNLDQTDQTMRVTCAA